MLPKGFIHPNACGSATVQMTARRKMFITGISQHAALIQNRKQEAITDNTRSIAVPKPGITTAAPSQFKMR
jgi:hypothetical protein